MISVTAAGGVLFRKWGEEYEVLLILRNGVWDLPKGKKDEGETNEECARREVAEEVGIPLPELKASLTTTYHKYERGGSSYGKTTHWFSMQTEATTFTPQQAEGITDILWAPLPEAQGKVGYENLRDVLQSFMRSLNSKGAPE